MIAFVQPFSLNGAGGGARILRSLLGGTPPPYLSLCTAPRRPDGLYSESERHLPRRPYLGRLERSRFAPLLPLDGLDLLMGSSFRRRLAAVVRAEGVSTIHALAHGVEFWHAYHVARAQDLRYVLCVHDDLAFNLRGRRYLEQVLHWFGMVWRGADARIVISEVMGEFYCAAYGARPYTVVTDGLSSVADRPQSSVPNRLHLYFMGSVHLSYAPNFQALLDALNHLRKQGRDVQLTVRGPVPFSLDPGTVSLRLLPWGTQEDIVADMQKADALYAPLPFGAEYDAFVRYSLSTKLVTYLGSGLPILYHGPVHSAAARLLSRYDAAVQVHAPTADAVAAALQHPVDRDRIVENALALARDQFSLDEQRRRFWEALTGRTFDRTVPNASPASAAVTN